MVGRVDDIVADDRVKRDRRERIHTQRTGGTGRIARGIARAGRNGEVAFGKGDDITRGNRHVPHAGRDCGGVAVAVQVDGKGTAIFDTDNRAADGERAQVIDGIHHVIAQNRGDRDSGGGIDEDASVDDGLIAREVADRRVNGIRAIAQARHIARGHRERPGAARDRRGIGVPCNQDAHDTTVFDAGGRSRHRDCRRVIGRIDDVVPDDRVQRDRRRDVYMQGMGGARDVAGGVRGARRDRVVAIGERGDIAGRYRHAPCCAGHRGRVAVAVQAHGHGAAIFNTARGAVDANSTLVICGVHHIIAQHGGDRDRCGGIYHEVAVDDGGIAREVTDRGVNGVRTVAQGCNVARGDEERPGAARNRRGVGVSGHGHDHRTPVFNANGGAGNRHGTGVVDGIDDVIAHNRIERDRCRAVHMHQVRRARGVARCVGRAGRNGEVTIGQGSHVARGYRHRPRTGADRGAVSVAMQTDQHGATILDPGRGAGNREDQRVIDHVQEVVGRDDSDSDRCVGIDREHAICSGRVAGVVTDCCVDIVSTVEHAGDGRRRHRDRPGIACHTGRVGEVVDGDGDDVAALHPNGRARERHLGAMLGRVDPIVGRDRGNGDRRRRIDDHGAGIRRRIARKVTGAGTEGVRAIREGCHGARGHIDRPGIARHGGGVARCTGRYRDSAAVLDARTRTRNHHRRTVFGRVDDVVGRDCPYGDGGRGVHADAARIGADQTATIRHHGANLITALGERRNVAGRHAERPCARRDGRGVGVARDQHRHGSAVFDISGRT